MAYRGHPSRYDAIIAVVKSTDITDPEETSRATASIKEMLTEEGQRPPECEVGEAPQFAYLRISGSISTLDNLLERALLRNAPASFVTEIARVLNDANRAFTLAFEARHAGGAISEDEAPPPAQPWTQEPPMILVPSLHPLEID